jgi:ABC-type Fe2+-enterobactin transport system substrate-binding protein
MWQMMESIANKVKDEVSSFWISSADVKLESFTLEIYEDSEWKEILTNVSLSTITKEQKKIIDDLTLQSKAVCESLNLPTQQVRLAA